MAFSTNITTKQHQRKFRLHLKLIRRSAELRDEVETATSGFTYGNCNHDCNLRFSFCLSSLPFLTTVARLNSEDDKQKENRKPVAKRKPQQSKKRKILPKVVNALLQRSLNAMDPDARTPETLWDQDRPRRSCRKHRPQGAIGSTVEITLQSHMQSHPHAICTPLNFKCWFRI